MSDNVLKGLEGLLEEFYSPNSSNQRKCEIEKELQTVSAGPYAWHYCLQLLQQSSSQYSHWYSLSVLENLVCNKWQTLDVANRSNLRQYCYQLSVTQLSSNPSYVTNKLVKVYINIGMREWRDNTMFFDQIMTLVSAQSTSYAGLTMLLVLSEEIVRNREDLSTTEYSQCKALLHSNAPIILSTIIGLLDSMVCDKKYLTPHSSPGSNPSVSPLQTSSSPLALCNTSPHYTPPHDPHSGGGELLSRLLQQTHAKTTLALDESTSKVGIAALKCLSHLLSWVPLTEVVSPGLLSTVFTFARQGALTSASQSNTLLGTQAMCCINEIVARNLVPAHLEEFILHLFHQTLQLLSRVCDEGPATLDRCYLQKFTEFLGLFTNGHLRRVESNATFPILDFLSLLFKFTFSQPDTETFFESLDVCTNWLDFLISLKGYMSPDGTIQRYGEALHSLANLLLNKVRFCYNPEELIDLEYDGEESEWDVFIDNITHVLGKVGELAPDVCSHLLLPLYLESCQLFHQIESNIRVDKNILILPDATDKVSIYKTLRDVSTLTHLAQLSVPTLHGEKFNEGIQQAQTVLSQCLECIAGCKRYCNTREKEMASDILLEDNSNIFQSLNRELRIIFHPTA